MPALILALLGIILLKLFGEDSLRTIVLRYVTSEESAEILARLILYALYSILGLIFLSSLGISLQSLLMTGGLLTLAISFAAQTVISNGISGLLLMIERPVKIGDYVEVKGTGVVGTVVTISLFSTALKMDNGEIARIPNSTFFSNVIVNKTRTLARRVEVEVPVRYEDVEKAIEIIKKYAMKDPDILAEPPPEIFVSEYGEYAAIIRLNAWVSRDKWYEVFKRIKKDILTELEKASLSIPYPLMNVKIMIDRK